MINKETELLKNIQVTSENFKKITPLTECLTNFVTVNDCANAILAIGGSPMMADEPNEVEEFVAIADVIVINMGNVTKDQIKSMKLACRKANEVNAPIVIDPVGVGGSKLRNDLVLDLIKYNIAAIRGNMSEIKAIANLIGLINTSNKGKGVDVSVEDIITKENVKQHAEIVKNLATKLNTVVIASGPIDIVSNGDITLTIDNGDEMMPLITGSGCMLSSIVGTCISASDELNGSIYATLAMAIAGENARKDVDELDLGTGSFRTFLIDYLYKTNAEELINKANMEIL